MGIDFGAARIGIAFGESDQKVASRRPFLLASGSLTKDAQAIIKIAENEKAQAIVVGIPVMEDANDGGKMQKICRMLGEKIQDLGRTVYFVDESGSTFEVESELRDMGLRASQRRKIKDSAAAQLILERFFAGNLTL